MLLTVLERNQHLPLLSLKSLAAPEHVNGTVKSQEKLLLGTSANTNKYIVMRKATFTKRSIKILWESIFHHNHVKAGKDLQCLRDDLNGFLLCFWPETLCNFYKIKCILNRKPRLSVLTLKINLCFIESHLQAWYTYEMYFLKPSRVLWDSNGLN